MTRDAPDLVLANARIVGGPDAPTDVTIRGGLVASIGRNDDAALERLDLEGRFLIPGLWDHHVHFSQWAKMRTRLDVTRGESAAQVAQLVAQRMAADVDHEATLVGFGFRDALWADLPTAQALDVVAPHRAVVLISGDLHSVWVNSAAQTRYGLVHHGLLREEEAFAVEGMLAEDSHDARHVLTMAAVHDAAARGVVGIIDYEMDDNVEVWAARMADGLDQLRVKAGFYKGMLGEMIERGMRTGQVIDGTGGLLSVGALKIISDGSLNTRTAYCHDSYPDTVNFGTNNVPPAELEGFMQEAADHGFEAAIHAIGDLANTLALDAFEATGARGSIEHAQLLTAEDIERFARLGVVASVQPEHAMDDRDVADALWPGRTERAFPLASLQDAGVRIALGSDAPVAPLDPWVAIAAAVERSRDGRDPWHPEQQLTRAAALAASTQFPAVAVGMPADLVACEESPLTASADVLRTMGVALTLVGGRVTWSSTRSDASP
ncbi:MAG: amidohydrolase [Actinobacteria bacterium HGW-Actinobacteria-4]|nr:MAG: amidohydrolase [Actinobacteria bacterium HGW-Actinobacteria-4]